MDPGGERELLEKFRALGGADRRTVLDLVEFLASRAAASAPRRPATVPLPRPAGESVAGAIRRLARSWPVADAEALLHRASSLMSEHVVGGRAAAEIIDELERVFAAHYAAGEDAAGHGKSPPGGRWVVAQYEKG